MSNTETKNYTLGRGDLFFAERRANGTLGGERLIGNTPSFNLSATSQLIKHYSSARGVRVQDREVPVQVDYAGGFQTDDINPKNLAMLFLGEHQTDAVSSAVGVVETFTDVEQGLSYQLGMSVMEAGLRNLSNIVVEVATVPQVLNTDYTVDAALGRITIVDGGGIADGADIEVTFDNAAYSQESVLSGSTVVEGALRFIAYNPEGDDIDYYLRDVKLAPNGDYNIKTDQDWQAMNFNVAIQTPDDGNAILAGGRPYTP